MSDAQPFNIRDAREDDLPALRALTRAAYAEYATIMTPTAWAGLSGAVDNALTMTAVADCLVAERDGRLIGTVMLFPPALDSYGSATTISNDPELRMLAVATAARGQGVGRALTLACIDRARQQGATALGLHTSDSLRVAIHLYKSMGFVRAPEYDFQPPGGELVKAYRLDLSVSSG